MDAVAHFNDELTHQSAGLRHASLRGYCTSWIVPLSRKSVEPMATHLEPMRASAKHQSLHHFVSTAKWSDSEMLHRVRQWAVAKMDFSAGGMRMTRVSPRRASTP